MGEYLPQLQSTQGLDAAGGTAGVILGQVEVALGGALNGFYNSLGYSDRLR